MFVNQGLCLFTTSSVVSCHRRSPQKAFNKILEWAILKSKDETNNCIKVASHMLIRDTHPFFLELLADIIMEGHRSIELDR